MFKPIEDKFDFIQMEKKWLKHWYENGIVYNYLKKNKDSKKTFSFIDGPITANNPMGVHHAWGRTYKDLWPKFFNLLGYCQRFQNGFDCQGLWVEVEVEKELGLKTKKDIENLVPGDKYASIAKFVQLCKERVKRFAAIQTEQSKRLGYFADWEHSYFTMSDENNYMIWQFLKKCYENGWIYKGRESVPWCPRCETAISQHEMLTEDYKEVVHDSVYFTLPIINRDNEYLLVWTTTPWTIPANIAVAIEDEFDYCLVNYNNKNYWLVKERVEAIFSGLKYKVIKTVKGSQLSGLKYIGPFDDLEAVKKVAQENPDKFHIVFSTDNLILPITTEDGTGLVHTAVSAGTEDFLMGKKIGLPMIPVIEDNADYLPGLGFLTGKNAKKHPELILDYLKEKDFVFKIEKYKHRYPACWRCKTELVWKVAEEWYIAMDKPSKEKKTTLRQRMIEVAKKIKWMPEFGLDRELDWLNNMHDWLISKKNRYWGLSLPIYECEKCGHFQVIGSKEELKEKAVEGWDKFDSHSPHKPYIDEVKIKCEKCGVKVSRIPDVGNPWLDAGIVPYSTITKNNQGEPLYKKNKDEWRKWFPADFITESFPGQFKNWFYALIAQSTVMEDEPPFKRVLGYGTLLGEDGRPMHKSWGNSIEFNEGADKIGVDVMRWMYAKQDPSTNMLFGYKKADEARRLFYLILWNSYKFFVDYSILDRWTPSKDKKFKFNLLNNVLDKWIVSRFVTTGKKVELNLKNFDAKNASLAIEEFVSDLSTWYIRRSRDRVWVNNEDEKDKNSFYHTMYYILVNLSIVLSPFLPFISEEIYTNLTGGQSVHLEFWPIEFIKDQYQFKELEEQMILARKVVEIGHSKRKELGVKVRKPLLKLEINIEENIKLIPSEIWEVVLKELNIKNIVINNSFQYPEKEIVVSSEELEYEGEIREFIRLTQAERKKLGLKPSDYIKVNIPVKFSKDEKFLRKKLMIK